MSVSFRPASSFTDRHGLFVSLTGGTNSGKTFSALRLARGIAGPKGKIAVADTEGGRTLHLKDAFDFDVSLMDPPFRPDVFADAAKNAEDAGYDVCVMDSFSMQWAGLGGVLEWQATEIESAVERARARNDRRSEFAIREANKMMAWIKPKMAHKAMVYSLLQRRIPIVFSIRGEETIKPGENGEKPTKIFKSVCNKSFPFEMTIAFRLAQDRKGIVDLSDPTTWKMEAAHRDIFHDGDLLTEDHGAKLAAWARGELHPSSTPSNVPTLAQRAEKAIANLQATEPTLDRFTKAERACAGLIADLDAALETALRANLIAELARLRSACDAQGDAEPYPRPREDELA